MDFEQLIQQITPGIHRSLKRAVEIGKWPNGTALTPEQRATCMEAVISYEQQFVAEEDRVGYIDRGSKQQGETCSDDGNKPPGQGDETSPLKWT